MRGLAMVGVVLVVLGLVGLMWPVITYTKTEKVVDLGPVEVTAENEEQVPIPPVAGGLAIAAGIALVVVGTRRSR